MNPNRTNGYDTERFCPDIVSSQALNQKSFRASKGERKPSKAEDYCNELLHKKVCKQSSHCVVSNTSSHYCRNIHRRTRASLRSVKLNLVKLNQAIRAHPFIQNQVINHPRWVPLCLSFFFLSRVSPLWQDCGQVGVQVCPLIHNDRWPLSLLPGDSVLAGLTGRASCTSGRQGTGQTRCPGGVTEERSAIAMYREIIS